MKPNLKFLIFNFQFSILNLGGWGLLLGAWLLSPLSLLAQAPAPAVPPDASAATAQSNRLEMLRRALRAVVATNEAAARLTGVALTNLSATSAPPAAAKTVVSPVTGPKTNEVAVPSAPPTPTPAKPAPPTPPPTAAPSPVTPAPLPDTNGLVATTPPPGTTNIPPDQMLEAGTVDFRGADLPQVLQYYAILVNRTILRPASLAAAPIVLTTQTPLSKREIIQALDTVLGMNGITMINFGDKFVKAEQVQLANQVGAPISTSSATNLPDFGSYLTQVVQLKHVKPSGLIQVLQPFSKIPNSILPIDDSQILVLRDFTENVKRMLEMIEKIDIAVESEFISEVIPIKYAKATEIAQALNSLSSGGGGTTVGGGAGGGTTRATTGRGAGFGGGRTGGFGTPGYQQGLQPGFNPPGALNTPQAQPPAAAGTFTDRLRSILKGSGATGEIVVLGNTKMIADERSNSLLIYASREDMKTIKDIILKLDVVLAQVLIEAVIIEVSLADSRDVGISYLQKQLTKSGSFTGVGAINNKGFLSPNNFSGLAGTNGAGSLPGGLSYWANFGGDLDVTVAALATDSRARILQTPRIQTSHNEPASIFVGESRPYPQGSYYGGGSFGGYSTIQQLQIGVSLNVTPLINPDGLVVMDISEVRIESVNGSVNLPNVGEVPITSQKTASAKVSVRDRDTIILGGLMETSKSKSASGVPFLKDIPLLGYLFRSTSSRENRSELLVLIRPTVLPTPEVAALTAKAEKEKMPGVSRAEADLRADEAARQRAADRELNNRR